ncbi:conserved hypothetical protein [Trichinella spiralis]|uniref:hypothetical protein n=1 Tax=Trichinella spiralis TaxID=6334 RepID=UPI0001EFC090|nr:conserved hypothetical protein [Trichinella spiralis]
MRGGKINQKICCSSASTTTITTTKQAMLAFININNKRSISFNRYRCCVDTKNIPSSTTQKVEVEQKQKQKNIINQQQQCRDDFSHIHKILYYHITVCAQKHALMKAKPIFTVK